MDNNIKNKHRGSSFEDFLKEEDIFEECHEEAIKRVISFQLEQELKKQKMTKTELAKKMKTSRAAVDRLLDPTKTCTLKSLIQAALALGKELQVRFS